MSLQKSSYYFKTNSYWGQISKTKTGATQPGINGTKLRNLLLPLPPLPEQRRIAAVLNAIQDAIAAQEDVIAAAHQLKRSLMQRLFTYGPYREPAETRETEIGEIPAHWEVVALGERVKTKSGGTPSRKKPEYWDGTIPWVKTTEVNYRRIESTAEMITEEGLKNSSAKLFPAGTVLIAMYGQGVTRGRVATLGIDATTNQACAALFVDDSMTGQYLHDYLMFSYLRIRELGHGANQRNLSAEIIRTFPMPVPTPLEQDAITMSTQTVDTKIAAEEDRLTALRALFKSMLHQLMTGRIRLLSDDEELPEQSSQL